ncbi:hypothetical protein D3C77_499760 [compost metagenome]
MSPLRSMAPASMAVCISSPVRSRKPVLMNTTRDAALAMQALRLTLVRRSSSMMPIFRVLRGMPSRSSTWLKISAAKATSSGPCIFGLTMYTLPLRVFLRLVLPLRLCRAIRLVNRPSWMPSGISLPWASRIAGLVIRWPTLRMNSSERPGRVSGWPSAPW